MNEMPTFAEKRLALEERAPRQDAKHGVARGVDRARQARASARTRSGSKCSTSGARARSTTSTKAGLELCDAVRLVADGHVPDKVWEEAEATSKPDELARSYFAIGVINAWNRLVITARTKLAGNTSPRSQMQPEPRTR
jgi:hypothetical protein